MNVHTMLLLVQKGLEVIHTINLVMKAFEQETDLSFPHAVHKIYTCVFDSSKM